MIKDDSILIDQIPQVYYDPAEAIPPVKYISPGDIIGQVVDEQGAGLYSGFFVMDLDGNPISQDFFTDAEGRYHTTYPAVNAQSTFIQFYATNQYEPVVYSYPELKANPTVLLKKKGAITESWVDLNTTLSLVGLGIALISLKQKKSVGAVTYIQKVKALPTGTKLLIAGAGAAALYLIFKYKPTPEQQEELRQADGMLNRLASYGIVPSLSLANFSSLVSVIVQSVDGCGTDEESIYRSFEALHNEADIYQLIKSYGIAKYKGCTDDAGFLSRYTHKTLSETIASDLTNSEVREVNSILGRKDISFTF